MYRVIWLPSAASPKSRSVEPFTNGSVKASGKRGFEPTARTPAAYASSVPELVASAYEKPTAAAKKNPISNETCVERFKLDMIDPPLSDEKTERQTSTTTVALSVTHSDRVHFVQPTCRANCENCVSEDRSIRRRFVALRWKNRQTIDFHSNTFGTRTRKTLLWRSRVSMG